MLVKKELGSDIMYENILLESGKVFRGRVSGVGGKVVDDSKTITITVTGEGAASIILVDAPDIFTPDVEFEMYVTYKNVGTFADKMFARLTDVDTGEVLKDMMPIYLMEPGDIREQQFLVTLSQTTDFHGRVDVGHEE